VLERTVGADMNGVLLALDLDFADDVALVAELL